MNNKICFYTPPFPYINSYFDMIDAAKKYGLSAVEGFSTFEFSTPDTKKAEEIKKYADSNGITIPCFSVFSNLVGENAEETKKMLKGYADVASVLGSPYLHHTIACEFSEPDNVIPYKDDIFRKGVAAGREIYDYAQTVGVKAVYEDQGFIFNGIKGFENFLENVDREIGIVADFGNIYQTADDIGSFVQRFIDRIVHVHIKDVVVSDTDLTGTDSKTLTGKYTSETEIGKGIIKISETIDFLKNSGYNGYYAIEFAAKENDSPVIENTIKLIDSWL